MALFRQGKEGRIRPRRDPEPAEKAEGKGDRPRAIAEYEKVLKLGAAELRPAREGGGACSATAGRAAEAWPHFVTAGEAYARDGFHDKAIAIYVRAAASCRTKVELWLSLADLNLRRQRKADAFKACLDGRRHFRRLEQHQQAGSS